MGTHLFSSWEIVPQAIGWLFISDLECVAGARYNYMCIFHQSAHGVSSQPCTESVTRARAENA